MCNLYSSKDLLSSENNSTINKKVATLSDNSDIHRLTMQSHVLFIMFMFCLLDRTIQICVSHFRAVKMWFFEYNSLMTTGCSTWHLMAKRINLRIRIVALHKDGLGYKKFGNTLTGQWPGSYRGFPRRFTLGTGLARVDQRSWVLVLCVMCRSWLQRTRMSAASIVLEVAEVEGQLVSSLA